MTVCTTCDYTEQVFNQQIAHIKDTKKPLHVSAAVRSLLQGMSILKDTCSVLIVNFTICNAGMLLKHQWVVLF